MMNNKGFTLIELIATIVILALVVGLGSYAITGIIKSSKEKSYTLLIENIENASETYYQECKYVNNTGVNCNQMDDNKYSVSLGDLVNYGYLKGNGTNEQDKYTIVNPKTNDNISSCAIAISYTNGNIEITSISSDDYCPTEYTIQESPSFASGSIGSSGTISSSDDVVTPVDPVIPVDPRKELS